MDADPDTFATALRARTDDLVRASPQRRPWRRPVGTGPRISDAELVALAVLQALLGFTSEARWLRFAAVQLGHLFPYLPSRAGYDERLRRLAGTLTWLIRQLAVDTGIWPDDVWVVDSTPIECDRSREAVRRSELAGWAGYGFCADRTRYF